ncbi:hypothetical protein ARMGADRAFT_1085507 [Armillaria gallica]|uniref:Protein kinase domain-containing protein n=1 Tax=Armillaria gallica TaxID=47427 RepID=A0A2H3D7R8_ARMGA|nr:hypothetical protein ARMGADRAFT_1085507 [Armillaria gallica]
MFVTLVKKKGIETAIPPLQGLKAAAEVASIPILGSATDIILSILEIIKNLLSLDEICVKTYASVQHFEQNIARINATLQRIEQTVALMKHSEPALKFEGVFIDIVPRSHFTPFEVITDGPGYSLQKAEMCSGKIITIKVFTCCKAKSTSKASYKLESKVIHSNLPHLFGMSSPDSERPFLVYDLDIMDHIEGVILSWMRQNVDEIMYMCAGMIHGISSALNSLSEQAGLFDMGTKNFDILWDARGRVILSLCPEMTSSSTALASPEDHTLRLLRVMDDICVNIFHSVNHTRYNDEPDRTYTMRSITQVDEDTSSLASSSQPSSKNVIPPRRELVWQAGAGRDTDLHKISQEYGSFVRGDKHFRQHVRRIHAQVGNPFLHHQCAAYQREDLTLTHAILDNRVVLFTVPSFGEVCVVCGTVLFKSIRMSHVSEGSFVFGK